MARTKNDQALKDEFAARLNEEFDRVGEEKHGRAARIALEMAVSHTSANGWLHGNVPALQMLRDLCSRYDLDFLYVCTGRRETEVGVDMDLYGQSMKRVNQEVKRMKVAGKLSTEQLSWLYVRTYQAMLTGSVDGEALEQDVKLAAG